jgi:hypothetical protein
LSSNRLIFERFPTTRQDLHTPFVAFSQQSGTKVCVAIVNLDRGGSEGLGTVGSSLAVDTANERTKPEVQAAQAVDAVRADGQATADCSLVRTEAASESGRGLSDEESPLTLVDLFSTVRDLGGKIVRSDDGFRIERLPEEAVTPQLRSALLLHRDELNSIVPNTKTDTASQSEASNTPGDIAEVPVVAEQGQLTGGNAWESNPPGACFQTPHRF